MKAIRLHFYLKIKDAKDAQLDGWAFFLMELFSQLYPDEPSILDEYNHAVIERFTAQRHLQEIIP